MKVHQEDTGLYVLSLARGESIRECIESLARDEEIVGAKLSAIGAIEAPELGLYDWPSRSYERQHFPGIWELLSLEGNLSLLADKPFLHAHITMSGPGYNVLGGHLFDAQVAVVFECFIEPLKTPLPRMPCAAIGLPRWEPGDA